MKTIFKKVYNVINNITSKIWETMILDYALGILIINISYKQYQSGNVEATKMSIGIILVFILCLILRHYSVYLERVITKLTKDKNELKND